MLFSLPPAHTARPASSQGPNSPHIPDTLKGRLPAACPSLTPADVPRRRVQDKNTDRTVSCGQNGPWNGAHSLPFITPFRLAITSHAARQGVSQSPLALLLCMPERHPWHGFQALGWLRHRSCLSRFDSRVLRGRATPSRHSRCFSRPRRRRRATRSLRAASS